MCKIYDVVAALLRLAHRGAAHAATHDEVHVVLGDEMNATLLLRWATRAGEYDEPKEEDPHPNESGPFQVLHGPIGAVDQVVLGSADGRGLESWCGAALRPVARSV